MDDPSFFRNTILLCAVFYLVFTAYLTAQSLTTTVNKSSEGLGHASLAAVYLAFAIGSVFSAQLVARLGPPRCLLLGAIPYAALVGTFLTSPSYALNVPMFALCGLGASIMWNAQAVYLMRNAAAQAALTGEHTEDVVSRFNGIFYGSFQTTGGTGLLVGAGILYGIPDARHAAKVLFATLTALATLGVLLACFLRPVPKRKAPVYTPSHSFSDSASMASGTDEGSEVRGEWPPAQASVAYIVPAPGTTVQAKAGQTSPAADKAVVEAADPVPALDLTATLRQAACDPRMRLLIPIIFYNGMSLAFLASDFREVYAEPLSSFAGGASRSAPLLSDRAVTIVMAVFFFVNSATALAAGRLAPVVGRSGLFAGAALTHVAFMALVLAAEAQPSWLPASGTPGAWATTLAVTVLFSLGDSVWESQVPAVLQSPSMFPREGDREVANGNLKLWQSLGYAVQFAIGIARLGVWVEVAILTCALVLSLISLVILHSQVANLDASGSAGMGTLSDRLAPGIPHTEPPHAPLPGPANAHTRSQRTLLQP